MGGIIRLEVKMSCEAYLEKIRSLLKKLEKEQKENIKKAAKIMTDSISKGRFVFLFGSGHSVLPCMDIFPRYGTFVGFQPITDSRLMWSSVVGSGGTRELLWIERQEGYVKEMLKSYSMIKDDSIIIFSHGGVNAAPVEMALICKSKGIKVIAITNVEYLKISRPKHSSGKRLGDIADVVIDNCAPIEDALVKIKNLDYKVAPGSTVTGIVISMSLVSETAKLLTEKGVKLDVFVSPTVKNVDPDHNNKVYEKYMENVYKKW
jgi:uncharacterized phosphosugar-binding protein